MTIENKHTPYAQRGFATVLVVLLVGLAVAASALGTAYYINTSQKSLVSSHALTNAQSGAWTGVEIFRKYLNSLDAAGIESLDDQNLTLNVQGDRELKVNNISSIETSNSPKQYRVTANIQNISEKSEASSTIQIVYEVLLDSDASSENSNSSGTTSLKGAMNFYGGLTATGNIDLSNAGQKAIINVEGNINKTSSGGGVSLKGVKRLNATGSVELGAETKVEEVYSNKYIIIDGSAAVTKIASALQYIKMKSASSQGDLIAGNSNKITLNEIKKEDVYVTTENSGYVNSINTLNNTYIKNGGSKLGTLIAGGNVTCPKTSWQNYTVMRALSFDSSCSTVNRYTLDGVLPLNAIEVSDISFKTKPIVNALAYITQANYIFSVDGKNNILVTVKNLDGITDGSYYLARNPFDNFQGQPTTYLCKNIKSDGTCSTLSDVVGNLGTATWGNNNKPVSYDISKKEWTLQRGAWTDTLAIAPGVLFFNGNLIIGNGDFANTIIATGNITYGQSTILEAPNYAGANKTCNASGFKRPKNLCDTVNKLSLTGIGNIALLAGSCTDDSSVMICQKNYSGGNITIGSSAKVYGNIIAGNILSTEGSTKIYGSVLAAALGNAGFGSTLKGSTTIDFNGISDEQTTITLPNNGANESEDKVATEKVKIKWARYV